jgi:hypothetical protein
MALARGSHPRVLVCATRKPAELTKTLRITAKPGGVTQVVMRLGPGEVGIEPLPDLAPGDRLKVLVELEVTTDCATVKQGDCVQQPYTFSPTVHARTLLADSPDAIQPRENHALLVHDEKATVTQEAHHRVFVFEPTPIEIPSSGLPWGRTQSYINVALDASHPSARKDQVLLIGENEQGEVGQDKGRISVVRLRLDGQAPPNPKPTTQLRASRLSLDETKQAVFSVPLEDLQEDEQLVVGAALDSSARDLPYKARISTRLVLADGPDEVDTGKTARRISSFNGEISEHNGTNCPAGATLTTRKVGILRMTKAAKETHYVNLVAESSDPEKHRTDKWLQLTRGSLAVTRYPAAWKG